MTMSLVALRSAVFAGGFLWLWTWAALLLRRFDDLLGGPLPFWSRTPGLVALAAGGAVVAWCIGAFVIRGHGTPAIFDPPRRFVAAGPYRYVRNPMYIGGALLLLGLGMDQRSPSIVLSVPAWWLLFHLLVILYEEAALHCKFGRDYDEYCRRTPRWIPRFIRPAQAAGCVALLVAFAALLNAAEDKPNFTGEWKLNPDKSDFGPLRGPDRRTDEIEHVEPALRLVSRQARGERESIGQWECRTDGSRCSVSIRGAELQLATHVTWDGAVLVFDSRGAYDGGQVRISDRWTLSPDSKMLTIVRRLSNETGEAQQTVLLERQ